VWRIPKHHESSLLEYEGLERREKRRGQLKELIDKNRVDILCLQETMKREFSISELRGLVGNSNFSWNWTACSGHSGGTLIGVKQGDLDAVEMDEGKNFKCENKRKRGDFC
jgi:exonuclease III